MSFSLLVRWLTAVFAGLGLLLVAPSASFAQKVPLRWETMATHRTNTCPLYRRLLSPDFAEAVVADCERGWWRPTDLPVAGYQHFEVNTLDLDTSPRAGAYRDVEERYLVDDAGTEFVYQRGHNTFEAFVPWPVLRQGVNNIKFRLGPLNPYIGESANILWMDSPGGPIHLKSFLLYRSFWEVATGNRLPRVREMAFTNLNTVGCHPGSAFLTPECMEYAARQGEDWWASGDVQAVNFEMNVSLSLKQINPNFETALVALEAALVDARNTLITNASSVANFEEQLRQLDTLPARVDQLLAQGIDNIRPEDLDALLSEYPMIPESARAAVTTFVNDTKKTIEQLRKDLADIQAAFAGQADSVAASVYQNIGYGGFDPRDPRQVSPSADLGVFGEIALPTAGSVGGFDPTKDPYKAYADGTIKTLEALVDAGNKVRDKLAFGRTVLTWQRMQRTWQRYLDKTPPTTAEVAAFIRARNRMTDFLRTYLDDQGWFRDCTVAQRIRTLVDGTLRTQFPDEVADLKEIMNQLQGDTGRRAEPIVEAIGAIGAGAQALGPDPFDDVEVFAADYQARVRETLSQARTILTAYVGGVFGLIPGTGSFIDFCESITGRELCDDQKPPSLSNFERGAALLGWVPGVGKMWKGMALGTAAGVAMVLEKVARRADAISDLARLERRAMLVRLGAGTVMSLEGLAGKEVIRLADKFGDRTIHQLAPRVLAAGIKELDDLKFLAKLMNSDVVKHATTHGAAVKGMPSLAGKTGGELRALFRQLGFVTHPGSTAQEVWTHSDGSVIRLATDGTKIRQGPHLKKEIAWTPHAFTTPDIACKVTDAGALAPTSDIGTDGAGNLLSKWFQAIVGRMPDKSVGGELELLTKIWGDATHIPYNPP